MKKRNHSVAVAMAMGVMLALVFATNPLPVFGGGGSKNCTVFEQPDPGLVGSFRGAIRWVDGGNSGTIDVKYTLSNVNGIWELKGSWDSRCTGDVNGLLPFKVYKEKLVSPDGDIVFKLRGGKVTCEFHREHCEMKRL